MLDFLNIFTEDQRGPHPWILRRGALEIRKQYPAVSINGKPRAVNYSINYAIFRNVPGIRVGHYTHLEETGKFRARFIETVPLYNYYTVTCNKTALILMDYGAAQDRIFKIPYGCDERMIKKPVFGVVGRTYPSGRKGEYLVERMVAEGYDVRAWGRGWPVPEGKLANEWDELPDFYRGLDYLVVMSLNEGGPVPVIDAIASGVPVIAPDVGWCFEYPVIRYKRGDWGSLFSVLKRLTQPPTWAKWSAAHGNMFTKIAKQEGLL